MSEERALLSNKSDNEEGEGSNSEGESNESMGVIRMSKFCIGCVLGVAFIVSTAVVWSRQESCNVLQGQDTSGWNEMLPQNVTMQLVPKVFALFSHEVDVHPENQTGVKLGYWSNTHLLFGLLDRYTYTDTRQDKAVTLEAREPWGLFPGLRYSLWRCAGEQEDGYGVEEDWGARPWFNWQAKRTFNIVDKKTGLTIARSVGHKNGVPMMGLTQTKEIDVTDIHGGKVAHIFQESLWEAGFNSRRIFVENLQPELVPNEVISFLGAVWELNAAKGDGESSTSSRSSSGKR